MLLTAFTPTFQSHTPAKGHSGTPSSCQPPPPPFPVALLSSPNVHVGRVTFLRYASSPRPSRVNGVAPLLATLNLRSYSHSPRWRGGEELSSTIARSVPQAPFHRSAPVGLPSKWRHTFLTLGPFLFPRTAPALRPGQPALSGRIPAPSRPNQRQPPASHEGRTRGDLLLRIPLRRGRRTFTKWRAGPEAERGGFPLLSNAGRSCLRLLPPPLQRSSRLLFPGAVAQSITRLLPGLPDPLFTATRLHQPRQPGIHRRAPGVTGPRVSSQNALPGRLEAQHTKPADRLLL